MPLPGQTIQTRVISSADPAAGAEISYTADDDMIVYSARFTFVTDANVANRNPSLIADDGTTQFLRIRDAGARTASATWEYFFAPGITAYSVDGGFPLPTPGVFLRKGDRLRTSTTNLQAGDNYSAMVLLVEYVS